MTQAYTPPADARTAASLLLLRDGEAGLEVLMLRRAERDGDLRSGAAVFPGGVVDRRDREAHPHSTASDDRAWSERLGLAAGGLDYAIAALRETFEEVGLLLARQHDGQAFAAHGRIDALFPWRARLNRSECSAAELAQAFGLHWDTAALAYYSHWLTPPGVPKRFDTRFFCALAPQQQVAQADLGEAVELMWLTPAAALAPERGLKLLPVTRRTLQELSRFGDAGSAYGEALERRSISLTMPRVARSRKGPRILLPDELPHAEVGRLDPEGRADVWCEIEPGRPVQLSPRVLRVTAPNPGPMTGPGTNSYLVGDPSVNRWTVIDPGPAIEAHVQALVAAAPGPIERILVTHTHRDHSPAAAPLAAATAAPVGGRVTPNPMWQDTSFAPAFEPADGERIVLGPGATLRVIHTPGHASNHLCYLLEEEQLLFTGDHVMQGSTVVINPPDGDMSAYLRSLQSLLDGEALEWLAPGHGFLVGQPQAVLRALIAHRLKREAKVLQALQAIGSGSIEELLPRVYDDVPAALHPVAARSLLAHLLKLEQDGAASLRGEVWSSR